MDLLVYKAPFAKSDFEGRNPLKASPQFTSIRAIINAMQISTDKTFLKVKLDENKNKLSYNLPRG